jgi:ABC-type multidrug transport system ATPase subunit
MQVEGLCFAYSKSLLFTNWSTSIPAGLTLLRGGDGSGKTTLLRLLAGQLHPKSGVLRIGQIRLNDQPALYRRQVFWVDPWSDAFDQMTAVSWIRSLHAHHPKFDEALLGEPFAALDKLSIGFLLELLQDAADHPSRAWVVTHHEAPGDLPLAATIDLTP